MKKYTVILLVLLSVLTSCRSTKQIVKESWLIGKWNIVDIDTGEEIPENNRAEYDEIMAGMIKNAYMKFNADNSFEMQLMGQELKGSYRTIDEESKLITTISGEQGEDHFKVIQLEPRKIILETRDDEGEMKLTLIREN